MSNNIKKYEYIVTHNIISKQLYKLYNNGIDKSISINQFDHLFTENS